MLSGIIYLTGPTVPCNVIINTHLKDSQNAKGIACTLPVSIGKALSLDIGKWFNNVWCLENKGDGKIVVQTQATRAMDFLKTSRPSKVKAEEEVTLAELFNNVLGGQ